MEEEQSYCPEGPAIRHDINQHGHTRLASAHNKELPTMQKMMDLGSSLLFAVCQATMTRSATNEAEVPGTLQLTSWREISENTSYHIVQEHLQRQMPDESMRSRDLQRRINGLVEFQRQGNLLFNEIQSRFELE